MNGTAMVHMGIMDDMDTNHSFSRNLPKSRNGSGRAGCQTLLPSLEPGIIQKNGRTCFMVIFFSGIKTRILRIRVLVVTASRRLKNS
jgi:hypothetical protein